VGNAAKLHILESLNKPALDFGDLPVVLNNQDPKGIQ
jgi:hypothetical protein